MKILKAFAQIGALTDNTKDKVAPVGELSPMSKTFVRNMTEFVHADFPNETFVSFSYKVDGVETVPPDELAHAVLTAINWIYTQARLGTFTEQKDSLQQAFIDHFGTTFDFINSGKMVSFGNYWAPEYILFAPVNGSDNNAWRVWFADDSFYNQFDEFTILVVPPIDPIDQFFEDYDDVKTIVGAVTRGEILGKVRTVKGAYPETVLRSDTFTYQNAADKTLKVDTEWTTVIYGLAGDNLDNVKEAIRTYILANSTHTRDEWAEIFPDLFTSTEYIVVPCWNDYSVPNAERQTGIYSGIVEVPAAQVLARAFCKGVKYNDAHVDAHLSVVPSQYKSLMLLIVGGPENRDGIDMFRERYPDYMNVYTTHVDFGRMSLATRQFVMALAGMLIAAEEMTVDSSIPQGYNRTIRDGVVYLSMTIDKFLYLVATRYSVAASANTGG